jgi:molybdopterin molybdotransferase
MAETLLSIAEARQIVLDSVHPLATEHVPVRRALGRGLIEDVCAAGDVPPFDNSAMDVGESRAGAPALSGPNSGEALRISTGAVVPPGELGVVPIEQVTESADGWVVLADQTDVGRNVRRAGEDMRRGAVVLRAGSRLGPAELGVAVAAGRAQLACARAPRVAIVCSGDELREPGAVLGPGEIHNSNAVTLEALTEQAGAQPSVATHVRDDLASTRAVLHEVLARSDVVIVSGGVSVGPHDHIKPALQDLGVRERFWRVALRPGKPTWFGDTDRTLVFGLPGNPVSVMVTFLLFVRPALHALQGLDAHLDQRPATLTEELPRQLHRDEAVRVSLRDSNQGLLAVPTGPQGSHQLSSMLGADALLIVRAGSEPLAAGSRVTVERIHQR